MHEYEKTSVARGCILRSAARPARPIVVSAGGNLQAALNQAQPGKSSTAGGATFDGNFILPVKTGTAYITVRTSTPDAQLPGGHDAHRPGARAAARDRCDRPTPCPALAHRGGRPSLAAHRPSLHRPLALATSSRWVTACSGIGRSCRPTSILDRVMIRGDATSGQKRGIALNSANTHIRNSYIGGHPAGRAGDAGDRRLERAGAVRDREQLHRGGRRSASCSAAPIRPSISWCRATSSSAATTSPGPCRGGAATWVVKNLLELKNARNVQIDGNLLENNWARRPVGLRRPVHRARARHAAPWTTIEHVRFENNVVRHSGSAINILGYDDAFPSRQLRDIVIRNNLFTDIDHAHLGRQPASSCRSATSRPTSTSSTTR